LDTVPLQLPIRRKRIRHAGWKWIHTPGHTEGHGVLQESDGTIIVGDAFTTTKQESFNCCFDTEGTGQGATSLPDYRWLLRESRLSE
jgi:glyoxylase-like metal-dependent hydrolase (beta-lactamase superfamily II)